MADDKLYVQGEISGTITNPYVVERVKTQNDYNNLINKPTLNGVEISGAKVLSDFGNIVTTEYLTKEERANRSGEISQKDVMYVITDYTTDTQGKPLPGIALGDGGAYIGDLPVIAGVAEATIQHIADSAIHVSAEDRTNWDDKVSATLDGDTLIFTT